VGEDLNGEESADFFGTTLAISSGGHYLAIGGPGNNGNGNDAGFVRVFRLWEGGWIQMGNDLDGALSEDGFGSVVAISNGGERLAVGGPINNSSGVPVANVTVYDWSEEEGDWLSIHDLRGGSSQYGYTLAMSSDGNRITISGDIDLLTYNWTGSDWLEIAEYSDDVGIEAIAISSDGNRVIIGGRDFGDCLGLARVYELSSGRWIQVGQDLPGDYEEGFGASVAMSPDGLHVAIGGLWMYNFADQEVGGVRIFKWTVNGWIQVGQDLLGVGSGDEVGSAVGLSADGTRVAIGGRLVDGDAGVNSGQVRIYDLSPSDDSWVQVGDVIDGVAMRDRFGTTLGLSADGSLLAIGGPQFDSMGENEGHVQVYRLESPGCVQSR